MNHINFRAATIKDIPTLLLFEQGVIEFERAFDSNLKDNTTYYDLEYLIQSNDAYLLVAEHNSTIIASGYGKIVKAQPYHKNSIYTYMGFMYVKPEFRGQGVIQKLIDQLKKWSISKDIFEVRLEVYSENTQAIKAYLNNGFKNHMIEMKEYLN